MIDIEWVDTGGPRFSEAEMVKRTAIMKRIGEALHGETAVEQFSLVGDVVCSLIISVKKMDGEQFPPVKKSFEKWVMKWLEAKL